MSSGAVGNVIITGATEGIGRAIARSLGLAGYRVGLCARTPSRLRETLDALRGEGIVAVAHPCDVGIEADVKTAFAALIGELGHIDMLVNNAGVAIFKPFESLTMEDWDTTMATNLRSLYLTTREVLPAMREARRGAVVNIASLSGRNGVAGGTAYAASKHAVLGFSRSLMLEVRQDNIRVITICPGSVDTPLMQHQQMLKPRLDRILQPEDVAATVLTAVQLPDRAMVSELDIRPTNP